MIWILPIILLPYIFPLSGFLLYCASGVIEGAFETVFLWLIFGINLGIIVLAAVGAGICFYRSCKLTWDPATAAKANMIIKFAQLPAKILYLVCCIFCILILPWAILVLFFFIAILLINRSITGFMGVGSVINLTRNGIAERGELVPHAILSFVTIADIVCAVLLYKRASQALDLGFSQQER